MGVNLDVLRIHSYGSVITLCPRGTNAMFLNILDYRHCCSVFVNIVVVIACIFYIITNR